MPVVVKRGYIPVAKTRARKYPLHLLKEGEYLDYFKWEEKDRVKYAVQKYNRDNNACLHVSRYPNGNDAHKFPHVIVGWAKGAKPRKSVTDKKNPGPKKQAPDDKAKS